jgi:hypothetical protein
MLKEQELKGVSKKQPKKGMQLGKKKHKKNDMIEELKKQNVIEQETEIPPKDSNTEQELN